MVFDTARPVEMRRFTQTEEAQLNEKPELLSLLAIEAYERFDIPKGVGLLEARGDGDDPPVAPQR
jgi:hypothetical protein